MAMLDLFSLLVQNMFGSILMAVLFLILCFFIYGGIMRMGILLISSISILYLMTMMTFAYGGVTGSILFFGTSIYFVSALIPWVSSQLSR